jgi:hypothetical protein
MKKGLLILTTILLMSSCASSTSVSSDSIVQEEDYINVLKVTTQKIYPGMSDGSNSYRQNWIIEIANPNAYKGELNLLLKNRIIHLGELQKKGVVIGNDNARETFVLTLNYPLEKHYPISNYKKINKESLLVMLENGIQIVELDSIVVLPARYYP